MEVPSTASAEPPRHAHGDLTSLAPHERLPDLLFDHFQFALIHGPDIPGSNAILLFTASDLASITSHIHSWVLFLLWFHPFILSGNIALYSTGPCFYHKSHPQLGGVVAFALSLHPV